MNNSDFQKLSAVRLKEARLLLKNNGYAGAYYLAGYVVECALKSCISAKTEAREFPPKPNIVQEYYKHDLASLLRLAGLLPELENRCKRFPKFESNWTIVKDWTEQTRYETKIDIETASNLL